MASLDMFTSKSLFGFGRMASLLLIGIKSKSFNVYQIYVPPRRAAEGLAPVATLLKRLNNEKTPEALI